MVAYTNTSQQYVPASNQTSPQRSTTQSNNTDLVVGLVQVLLGFFGIVVTIAIALSGARRYVRTHQARIGPSSNDVETGVLERGLGRTCMSMVL